MLRCADRVSLLADQSTALLTKISPFSVPAALVVMLAFVVLRIVFRVVAAMPDEGGRLPPGAAIVKSVGSINHVPVWPAVAAVVTFAVSAIFTCAVLVSMNPPSPPFGADASSLPLRFTVPLCMSPNSSITPALLDTVCASITPLWLTTALLSASTPLAVSTTWPPSALIKPPLSTRVCTPPASSV